MFTGEMLVDLTSGGSRISQRGHEQRRGTPTYYLSNFPQKQYEMKKFWAGGGASLALPKFANDFYLCHGYMYQQVRHRVHKMLILQDNFVLDIVRHTDALMVRHICISCSLKPFSQVPTPGPSPIK